jgi:hypothetical protein
MAVRATQPDTNRRRLVGYGDAAAVTTAQRSDTNGGRMQLDKQFVLYELRKEGKSDKVQRGLDELPEKIDHEQHAALLEKFGLDPGKLAEKAAERGIASL